jgi:hypothetical protein
VSGLGRVAHGRGRLSTRKSCIRRKCDIRHSGKISDLLGMRQGNKVAHHERKSHRRLP